MSALTRRWGRRVRGRLWLVWVLAVGVPGAAAQPVAGPARGLEAGVTAHVARSLSFGRAAASLDQPSGGSVSLFQTESRESAAIGVSAHVNVPAWRQLGVEVAGGWSRAELRTRVLDDFEGVPAAMLTEPFSRFTLEAGATWTVATSGRWDWFIRGSGGWMREVASSRVAAVRGTVTHVGAGVKYWWPRGSPSALRYGVRVEGRVTTRWRGLTLDAAQVHSTPAVAVGLLVGL